MMDSRPSAFFTADAVALDFVNSSSTLHGAPIEWLADKAAAIPGELDAVAAHARALREWFRTLVARHKGKPLRPTTANEFDPLNRLLALDENVVEIMVRKDAQEPPSGLACVRLVETSR
jgi:hypothetical protein